MRRSDGYAPIESYASIGDGRTIALVSDDGRIDWFPVPDLDCPPIFGALLDSDRGGHLELAPVGRARCSREYLTGTNVLVATYTTDRGSVRVTDSLNSGVAGRLPWTELARRVDGLRGHVEMQWAVRPGHGWASRRRGCRSGQPVRCSDRGTSRSRCTASTITRPPPQETSTARSPPTPAPGI